LADLQTEFEFVLPRGYVDSSGTVHGTGTMRLATAMDELAPLRDPRVQQNEAYLVIILLARVITRLGDVRQVTPNIIESLYTADLAFLQRFYRQINESGTSRVAVECPSCNAEMEVDLSSLGGS
jgi:hypothetical protein